MLTQHACPVNVEGRGAAQKAVFGYMLGPSVQTAARSYEQFPLNPRVMSLIITPLRSGYHQHLGNISMLRWPALAQVLRPHNWRM